MESSHLSFVVYGLDNAENYIFYLQCAVQIKTLKIISAFYWVIFYNILSHIRHDPLIIIINRVVFCLLLYFPGKLKTRKMSWTLWDVFLLICKERWSRRWHPRVLHFLVGKLEIRRNKNGLIGIWWNDRGSFFIAGVVKLVRVEYYSVMTGHC